MPDFEKFGEMEGIELMKNFTASKRGIKRIIKYLEDVIVNSSIKKIEINHIQTGRNIFWETRYFIEGLMYGLYYESLKYENEIQKNQNKISLELKKLQEIISKLDNIQPDLSLRGILLDRLKNKKIEELRKLPTYKSSKNATKSQIIMQIFNDTWSSILSERNKS